MPTSSDDWIPFLERTGGVAPDLIGFGRSGKGGHLEYSLDCLTDFVDNFVDNWGLGRLELVAARLGRSGRAALSLRAPRPHRALVLFNSVPLVPGFHWHRVARLWRRPVIGELAMGATTSGSSRGRSERGRQAGWPDARIDAVWQQFDQGTQRAILRLLPLCGRAALEAAGAPLDTLDAARPRDLGRAGPWLAPALGEATTKRLADAPPRASVDAGHWPWLDEPRRGSSGVAARPGARRRRNHDQAPPRRPPIATTS